MQEITKPRFHFRRDVHDEKFLKRAFIEKQHIKVKIKKILKHVILHFNETISEDEDLFYISLVPFLLSKFSL